MAEHKFVDGLIVKRNEKAPEWIVCSLSFKVGDFLDFMNKNSKNGWFNADIKLSKALKYYAEVNTYDPKAGKPKVVEEEENQAKLNNLPTKQEEKGIEYPTEEINPEDIPF
jgi:hypothetical protein